MTPSLAREIAENLMIQILHNEELLSGLMGRSGTDPAGLREILTGPDSAEFVLDYVVETDERVIGLAEATGLRAADIGLAARILARRD